MLHEVFTKFDKVITAEDGCLMGGMGSAILEFMGDHQYSAKVVRLGVPDTYIHHGTPAELYAEAGFDTAAMLAHAKQMVGYSTAKLDISQDKVG